MLLPLLLAQQVDPITGGLIQYGAIGIFAAAMVVAVRMLWKRLESNIEAERQRADRLEAELRELNKLVTGELSGHLVRATEAMREVTDIMRQRDRGDR